MKKNRFRVRRILSRVKKRKNSCACKRIEKPEKKVAEPIVQEREEEQLLGLA